MNYRTIKINFRKALVSAVLLLTAYGISVNNCRLYGAFQDSGWGVRPQGMAGAYTAVADDANAPLYNPAGFALVKGEELSLMSAQLFTGLDTVNIDQDYLGFVYPLGKNYGSIGFAWGALSSPSLYREDTVTLGYGFNLNNLIKLSGPSISFGANVKYLKHAYTLDEYTAHDPVFANGTSAAATTGDVGIIVGLRKQGLAFALVSRNITSPDVGLLSADKVPVESVLGVSYHTDKLAYLKLPNFTSDLDVVSRDNVTDVKLGLETLFFDKRFAVRAGGSQEEITLGLGYNLKISEKMDLIVDYAFAWPLEIVQTSGSHRIGLSVRIP